MFLDIQNEKPVAFIDERELGLFFEIEKPKEVLWEEIFRNFACPFADSLKTFGMPLFDSTVKVFSPSDPKFNNDPPIFVISSESTVHYPGVIEIFSASFSTISRAIEGAWCLDRHTTINPGVSIPASSLYKNIETNELILYGIVRFSPDNSPEEDSASIEKIANVLRGISDRGALFGDVPTVVLVPGIPKQVVENALASHIGESVPPIPQAALIEKSAIEKLSMVKKISRKR